MLLNSPSNDWSDYHRFEDEEDEFMDLESGGVVIRKIESQTNHGHGWSTLVVVIFVIIGATIFMYKKKINQQIYADHNIQNVIAREMLNDRGEVDYHHVPVQTTVQLPIKHYDPIKTTENVWHILTGTNSEMTSQNGKWAVIRKENKESVKRGQTVEEPLQVQITSTKTSKSRDICYKGPWVQYNDQGLNREGNLVFQVGFDHPHMYTAPNGNSFILIGEWYRNWYHILWKEQSNSACKYLRQQSHFPYGGRTGGERPIRRCAGTWHWWQGGTNQRINGLSVERHLVGGEWTAMDGQATQNLESGYQNQNGTTCYQVTRFDTQQQQFYQIDFDSTNSEWTEMSKKGCAVQIDISQANKQRPVCIMPYKLPEPRTRLSVQRVQPSTQEREMCWMTIVMYLCPTNTFCCNGRYGDSCCNRGVSCGRLGCGDDGD